jgi:murein L,D-transpeptidase YcbB/YkuD
VLPRLKRDKNYLQERGFILVSSPGIDWRKLPADTVALQQPPGPDNVLGKIMLDMPNDFDVYLHDTPNKKLFTQADRTASNGCIRVEQIAALASLVLTNDLDEGRDKIDEAISAGETANIALAHPLPVYLVYSTAVADSDGNAGFRPDRYNRDAPLLTAMVKPAAAPDVMAAQRPERPRKKTRPSPSPASG